MFTFTMTLLAIETQGLVRCFGAIRALDGLDLTVRRGTVHGLLGPNGSGKTTAVRVLGTLVRPDAGRAAVLGHDVVTAPARVRGCLALTGQFSSVDGELTGRQNLVLSARLLGLGVPGARRRAEALLDAFDLQDAADRLVKSFSGGMRRRLDIAASLAVAPDVLVLDEPTTGLDPRSRRAVWELVRGLRDRGTTVLLTTQDLAEADALADRVSVLAAGRIVAEDRPAALRAAVGGAALRVRLADPADEARAAAALTAATGEAPQVEGDPPVLALPVAGPREALAAAKAVLDAGVVPADLAIGPPTLDDAFLALTQDLA